MLGGWMAFMWPASTTKQPPSPPHKLTPPPSEGTAADSDLPAAVLYMYDGSSSGTVTAADEPAAGSMYGWTDGLWQTVARFLPGGGRGGGRRLLSLVDGFAGQPANTTAATADGAPVPVPRELPGGGRGGGKRLMSPMTPPAAHSGNTTAAAVAAAGTTADTGVEAAAPRELPAQGRDGGKRLMSQSTSPGAALPPAAFRTGPSRGSGFAAAGAPRVQPRAVRLRTKPWSQCTWWEKIMGLVEALARINEDKSWC
jgi:hypothetical protein